MLKCPNCGATDQQVKTGSNTSGSQRIKCQHCKKRYTPLRSHHGYPDDFRNKAIHMSKTGISNREIGRQLGVSHGTVGDWIKSRNLST